MAHYHGTTWTSYLVEYCIHHLAIAPDGSVWLGANVIYREPVGLYVITPEAVAAKEAEVSEPPSIEEANDGQDPTTTDILPGVLLSVEEEEPGIFKVVNDGARDLALGDDTDIVAGHDGGIWLLREDHFIRLGSDVAHVWPEAGRPHRVGFEVAPDGTVWVVPLRHLPDKYYYDWPSIGPVFSFDGDGWTRTQSLPDEVWAIAVAPDGTGWASWEVGTHVLGPDGWQPFDREPIWAEELQLTDSGDHFAQATLIARARVLLLQQGEWHPYIV